MTASNESGLANEANSGAGAGSDDGFDESRKAVARQLDQLVARALAYRTGGELRALLEFTKRFPHIAPFNAMLLHIQKPGIRFALTADQWEKQYNHRVKPGAHPCVILWTMGPVAFVFDIGDTELMDGALELVPDSAVDPFPTKGQPPASAFRNLEKACAQIGIELDLRDLGSALAGRVYADRTKTRDFYLQLNSQHSAGQQLGTLAHELAHVFCGHLGATKRGFWPSRRPELKTREFEAEAVAWLVTERLNLDIGSVSYLASYLREGQALPDYSLDAVLRAAGKIEQMIAGTFRARTPKESP